MPSPTYATLGSADKDPNQQAIDLNIVDADGQHVNLGGTPSTDDVADALKAKDEIAALTSESSAADIVAALKA